MGNRIANHDQIVFVLRKKFDLFSMALFGVSFHRNGGRIRTRNDRFRFRFQKCFQKASQFQVTIQRINVFISNKRTVIYQIEGRVSIVAFPRFGIFLATSDPIFVIVARKSDEKPCRWLNWRQHFRENSSFCCFVQVGGRNQNQIVGLFLFAEFLNRSYSQMPA